MVFFVAFVFMINNPKNVNIAGLLKLLIMILANKKMFIIMSAASPYLGVFDDFIYSL